MQNMDYTRRQSHTLFKQEVLKTAESVCVKMDKAIMEKMSCAFQASGPNTKNDIQIKA